jgi:hypothetical protein
MHSIPSGSDTCTWADLAGRLTSIVTAQGDVLNGLHSRIPGDDRWQYKALLDSGDDIFAVTLAAFWAIDSLGRQPPTKPDPWPEGGLSSEDRLRIWAADPAGHKRPRWTVVAMAAMAWSNALEGFLSGLSEISIDVQAVKRVRQSFPDANIEWDTPILARAKIAQRMLPSTRRRGQSLQYIEAVFGCTIVEDIASGLQALVTFRNSVVHPKQGRTHDDHRTHPCSDQWTCWANAVRALAGVVIASLADRLDERRALGESIPLLRG